MGPLGQAGRDLIPPGVSLQDKLDEGELYGLVANQGTIDGLSMTRDDGHDGMRLRIARPAVAPPATGRHHDHPRLVDEARTGPSAGADPT